MKLFPTRPEEEMAPDLTPLPLKGPARLLLAATSSLLLVLSFPRPGWGNLVWIALVPLVLAVRGLSLRCATGLGLLCGALFFIPNLWWLHHVTAVGAVALALYCALYPALWSAAVARLWQGHEILSSAANIRFAVAAAAAWTVLEWLRGHLLTGFPWSFAGTALHDNIAFIQIADLAGVYGVSFLVLLVNVTLALTVERFRVEIRLMVRQRRQAGIFRLRPHLDFTFAVLVLCGVFAYGVREIFRKDSADARTLRVALVQANIPQDRKWDAAEFDFILTTYLDLTRLAAAGSPELVVWPESATPSGVLDSREVNEAVFGLMKGQSFSLLLGSNDFSPQGDFTGAFLLGPDASSLEIYHKMHLVPYGEFIPLRRFMPWMKKFVPIGSGFMPGTEPKVFTLPGRDVRLAPLICFEDAFPALARERARAGADALVNLTNAGWFKESDGVFQQLANAVFRAVETRRPLIRCTNTGVTCWVDPQGRIRDPFEPFQRGFKTTVVTLPPRGPATFYARHGDIFVAACAALLLLATLRLARRSRS